MGFFPSPVAMAIPSPYKEAHHWGPGAFAVIPQLGEGAGPRGWQGLLRQACGDGGCAAGHRPGASLGLPSATVVGGGYYELWVSASATCSPSLPALSLAAASSPGLHFCMPPWANMLLNIYYTL